MKPSITSHKRKLQFISMGSLTSRAKILCPLLLAHQNHVGTTFQIYLSYEQFFVGEITQKLADQPKTLSHIIVNEYEKNKEHANLSGLLTEIIESENSLEKSTIKTLNKPIKRMEEKQTEKVDENQDQFDSDQENQVRMLKKKTFSK